MSLDIAGLTTVPIIPLEHPSLASELMSFEREREYVAVRQALSAQIEPDPGPLWANVLIIIGALLMIMCGTFMIAYFAPLQWS